MAPLSTIWHQKDNLGSSTVCKPVKTGFFVCIIINTTYIRNIFWKRFRLNSFQKILLNSIRFSFENFLILGIISHQFSSILVELAMYRSSHFNDFKDKMQSKPKFTLDEPGVVPLLVLFTLVLFAFCIC